MIYEVDLTGGRVKDYAANVIDKNIFSQVDDKGYSVTIVEEFKRMSSKKVSRHRCLVIPNF